MCNKEEATRKGVSMTSFCLTRQPSEFFHQNMAYLSFSFSYVTYSTCDFKNDFVASIATMPGFPLYLNGNFSLKYIFILFSYNM